jgi:hypothetical protein
MSKGFWMIILLVLITGTARAQSFSSGPDNGCRFLIAEKENQNNPALNSDSTEGKQAACTIRTPPLTAKDKLRYMLRSTYEPVSIMSSLAGAGIKQATDFVPEWGQGMEGYGKRFASSYGNKVIRRSIQTGLGILMHEDPRYFPSGHSDIWQRSLYAASRTLVSNKDNGGIRPGYSKLIGTVSAVCISRQWYPERMRTPREYFWSSVISMGVDVGRNVFNEFWPDLKRMMHR